MATAFRQTAILPDCTGRYRTSIVLATRAYGGTWSESAVAEHVKRDGRVCPMRGLTISDSEWEAMSADSSLCFGYVDAPGDVDSPFDPSPWMLAPGVPLR